MPKAFRKLCIDRPRTYAGRFRGVRRHGSGHVDIFAVDAAHICELWIDRTPDRRRRTLFDRLEIAAFAGRLPAGMTPGVARVTPDASNSSSDK